MALADLEARYLDAAVAPIYSRTTEVVVHIHGSSYFPVILATINGTNAGDSIFVVGWQFNPNLNLATGVEEQTGSAGAIATVLAQKRAAGVDVRIVLNGTVSIHWVKALPFSRNLIAAELMRRLLISGQAAPPLADRVLYDWSGANWTGSHHQKATVIQTGTQLTAFVGGMDMVESHWDNELHNRPTQLRQPWSIPYSQLNGTPWGWHDVGVELQGEAAKGVWENFRHRWEEARTLPVRRWKTDAWNAQEVPRLFNPNTNLAAPVRNTTPTPAFNPPPAKSVQILRSRYRYKVPNRCTPGGINWRGFPGEPATSGPFFEVFRTLKRAIDAAQTYIYMEDQFLEDMPFVPFYEGGQPPVRTEDFSLYPAIRDAAQRGVKVAFLGSGRSDPDDPVPPLKNQELTSTLRDIIDSLPANQRSNVVIWRLERATVHSKLIMIDDEFLSIGSANFQSRSMSGIDSELHTAIVAEDDLVRNVRISLWSEHWALDMSNANVVDGIRDMDSALGLWHGLWYPADPDLWPTLTGSPNASGRLAEVLP